MTIGEQPRRPAFGPDDIDGVMCDLDGVLYRGNQPIAGAADAVRRIRDHGARVVFCTNNSHFTVDDYVDKLGRIGVPVGPEDVVTSGLVTASVLGRRGLAGKPVLVVGGEGIRAALRDAGIGIADESPGAVVVGWDAEFTYDKMRAAARAVMGGAALIATNADATFPAAEGLWPGAGAILASIETAAGVRAEVMGKPNAPMMDVAAEHLRGARRIAVIGDRPDSDLAGGIARGWTTILVLTGVTSRAEAELLDPPPDYVAESIADLAL